MKQRIISGAAMTLILILVLFLGTTAFEITMGLLAAGAMYELMNVKLKDKPLYVKFIGFLAVLLVYYSNLKNAGSLIFGLNYRIISGIALLCFIPTILSKKKFSSSDAIYLFGSSIFVGIVFDLLVGVYVEDIKLLLFLVIISVTTDTFALFGGKLIGKHKLTSISPKKTIEGSVVGTLFAIIIGTTYYLTLINNGNFFGTIILVTILSVVNQFGDLFFSLIKRENDIKDYSKLIPGHGGILDRFDGLIFVVLTFILITTSL